MRILQVVGYKNSGKTTLTSQLINYFTNKGLKVASLKHHGHGGKPKLADGTDSEKHRASGSLLAGVDGGGVFQLTMSTDSISFDQLVAFYQVLSVDLLVVEGYKSLDFDKIIMIKEEKDLSLLEQVSNVQAVITSIPIEENNLAHPIFYNSDRQKFFEWMESFILS
ncbi:molybdopterin-guanine dinucleotide biosynthesis protein B [Aquibacillus salsiterrae]|uniref:Molybdopterin-guanine dinucleotide biosynthesis protein B n=1 Tax=Aquibacillus salsiterrae TaxID=2950439 RepID=A0A9X4AH66_9BACI|nr:molybdopterin-guanine dinucleotide biosynthesis protein B [Aquibacillus salsiterrae]MDC3417848.1 molybdopterin-guanine dinucleotide biosynthesis protein B [Aquibacillus salsiterrae]